MWENLGALERHLGAQDMTSCEEMVVAHEQITALGQPEYVNLFTVQVSVRGCMCDAAAAAPPPRTARRRAGSAPQGPPDWAKARPAS